MRRQRRLGAHDAALAFEAVQQRGFLAADIGAGADADFHVEGIGRAQHVDAEHAGLAGDLDGLVHHRDGMRIFRADIDEALGRADRDAGDRHAFDQHEGIALHDHAVGEGGAVALVGVADDVFAVGGRIEHRLPLDAGREAGAAAAAQAGFGHLADDVGRRHGDRVLQALQPAMRLVVVERQRIDDAAAREGQPRLPGQERDLVGRAEPALVMAAGEEAAVEQAFDVGRLHRAVGDAAIGGRHLDHRLEEIGAARAVADDLGLDAALGESPRAIALATLSAPSASAPESPGM